MAGARGVRAGRAFVEIGTNNDSLERGLRAAQQRLRSFGAGLRATGTALLAGAVVGGAIFAGALKTVSTYGDQLDKASQRTGFAVETLSELGFAAEQSGASLETLENAIKRMQRSLVDADRGAAEQARALEELGLNASQLLSLSPENQLRAIADGLAGISDPTRRAALAMILLGRAGQQLLPLLSGGAAGMEALQRQARDFGLTVTTDLATSSAEFTDSMNLLSRVLRVVRLEIGGALAPAATRLATATARTLAGVRAWIAENQDLVRTVSLATAAIGAAGVGLIAFGVSAQLAAFALGGVLKTIVLAKAAVVGLGAAVALTLNPFSLLTLALVGGGAAFLLFSREGVRASASVRRELASLASDASETVTAIGDALSSGDLELAGEIAFAGLESAWAAARARLIGPVLDFWTDLQRGALVAIEQVILGINDIEAAIDAMVARAGKGFRDTTQGGGNFLARQLIRAQGALGILDDDEVERRLQTLRELRDSDRETNRDGLADALGGIAGRREGREDFVRSVIGGSIDDLAAEQAARAREAEQRLREAEIRRQELIDRVNNERTRAPSRTPGPDELEERREGVRSRVAGSFGSANLLGLQGFSAPQDRTARATETIVSVVRSIERKLDRAATEPRGAVFA